MTHIKERPLSSEGRRCATPRATTQRPQPAAAPPSLLMSQPGDVRVGPVFDLPAVLREMGADLEQAFAQAGVDRRVFDDPDNRMHAAALQCADANAFSRAFRHWAELGLAQWRAQQATL